MSNYGTKASQSANNTYGTQATTAYNNEQGDLSQFTQNEQNLQQGKNVGANPYLNPQYLAATARLRSGSLNQATNAGDAQLRATNARTGGMNSTATTGAIGNLALQKGRLGNTLGAEQAQQDWQKNIGYQQNLARMPLEAAQLNAGMYGTASGNQLGAIRAWAPNYMAAYMPWMQGGQAAGGAIAGAAA